MITINLLEEHGPGLAGTATPQDILWVVGINLGFCAVLGALTCMATYMVLAW